MKNNAIIIAAIIIIAGIASISAGYVYFTDNTNSNTANETLTLLNESGDLKAILTLDEYLSLIQKQSGSIDSPSDIIAKEEVKQAYTDIFSKNLNSSNFTIDVTDLIKGDDGKYYYHVIVTVNNDETISSFIFEQDATVKPELISSTNIKIKGVLNQYVFTMNKDDSLEAPKISEADILKIAKEEYAKYNNTTSNDEFVVQLFYTDDKKAIYSVDINAENELFYDANTGELIYSTLEADDTDYESICRQVALDRLNSENKNYSSYLSLENSRNESEPGSLIYTFDIVYKNGSDVQILGNVSVNAYTKEVVDFVIVDPELEDDEMDATADYNESDSNIDSYDDRQSDSYSNDYQESSYDENYDEDYNNS